MSKLRVGLLFGGRSVEHEVSLASASSIHQALDPARYEITLIAIDREGRWRLGNPELPPEATLRGEVVNLPAVPGERTLVSSGPGPLEPASQLDVIFPIVHGRGGEDGSLQGLLELADVPYVGSGVLGSALQMDKETAKRLLQAAGLPVLPWVLIRPMDLRRNAEAAADLALREIGLPLFVKPANQGSSVGIGKVSFEGDQLEDNLVTLTDEILRVRPAAVKGHYMTKLSVSSTMGPGVKVDIGALADVVISRR